MGIVQSLVILVALFIGLSVALVATIKSDTVAFPTRGTAMVFIAVLLAALPFEAVGLVATA